MTKGACMAPFVLKKIHLKKRANNRKECAKSGIIRKSFAWYFGFQSEII
ncbi:general secretion pathway protein A [Parageobacillus thermoglucosidasius]|nr:general secretion pathway protein A [Parageobacillus thermoglucosidasius]